MRIILATNVRIYGFRFLALRGLGRPLGGYASPPRRALARKAEAMMPDWMTHIDVRVMIDFDALAGEVARHLGSGGIRVLAPVGSIAVMDIEASDLRIRDRIQRVPVYGILQVADLTRYGNVVEVCGPASGSSAEEAVLLLDVREVVTVVRGCRDSEESGS